MPIVYRLEVPSTRGWLGIFKGTSDVAFLDYIRDEASKGQDKPWSWKAWAKVFTVEQALKELDLFFVKYADLHSLPWNDEIPALEEDFEQRFFENNPSWIFGFLNEEDHKCWFPPELLQKTLQSLEVHLCQYSVPDSALEVGCTQVMFDSHKATLVSRTPL